MSERKDTPEEHPIRSEMWRRPFNPLVMEVLKEYSEKGGFLFGLTGDLDNLGVYVARNGRPAAENLVDLYNQQIRNHINDWAVKNKQGLLSIAFIPSGEEVLVIGVSKDAEIPKQLLETVEDGVNNLMKNQNYIDMAGTLASFGGVVFGNNFDNQIKQCVSNFEDGKEDGEIYPIYLDILKRMRTEMALELDKSKFEDVLDGEFPLEVRQLVFTRMLEYKRTTKEVLKSLNHLPKEEIVILLSMLGDVYGIDPTQEDQIENFLNKRKKNNE